MKKVRFGLLGLLLSVPIFAYDLPEPKLNELIVIALNEDQLSGLISIENYPTSYSPRGNCYGIDRLNYTLLTKIKFIPGRRESYDSIRNKLLKAYTLHSTETIYGFFSLSDFMDKMEDEWEKRNNPLKRLINIIQNTQDTQEFSMLVNQRENMLTHSGPAYLISEAQTLEESILKGIPVYVAIRNSKDVHALTVIGLKKNLTQEGVATDFYALDSNHPNELQILSLKENIWYYRDWENEGTSPYVEIIWKKPSLQDEREARQIFTPQFLILPETIVLLNLKIMQWVH